MSANTYTPPRPTDEVARVQAQFGWDAMTARRHLAARNAARDLTESRRAAEAREALARLAARGVA